MTNSKGSPVVVGDEGTQRSHAAVVVVPDGRGEGEQSLEDPGDHACRGVSAVSFEVELAFQGVVDRLDELMQRLEEPADPSDSSRHRDC
jgi:hypothetical protein